MYATVEAELKNGRVEPLEEGVLPAAGHVLIVFQTADDQRGRWNKCRSKLGWLKTANDAAHWEREVRGEWEVRA